MATGQVLRIITFAASLRIRHKTVYIKISSYQPLVLNVFDLLAQFSDVFVYVVTELVHVLLPVAGCLVHCCPQS